jgi:hypothetical protein
MSNIDSSNIQDHQLYVCTRHVHVTSQYCRHHHYYYNVLLVYYNPQRDHKKNERNQDVLLASYCLTSFDDWTSDAMMLLTL